MKKIMFIILLLALSLPGLSFSAGTITETFTEYTDTGVYAVTINWTGSGGGGVSENLSATATAFMQGKFLYEVVTTPVTTPGDASPTTLYDVSINSSLGVDIMGGQLIDRSASLSQRAIPLLATSWYGPALIPGALTLKILNNTTASATGTVRLYLRR